MNKSTKERIYFTAYPHLTEEWSPKNARGPTETFT